MKVQDIDMTKESIQIQEVGDNVTSLLNTGSVEFEVQFTLTPADTAPNETKIVLCLFGATYRLYISYLGDWYYTALTKI